MTKYQNLKSDLRATWLLKEIEIIPLVIGATGLVKKNFNNYIESIPGSPNAREIQSAAINGTVTILEREHLVLRKIMHRIYG